MKTLITRAGPVDKIVCIGNLSQIDTPYLTATTSGLTYVVDRFKTWRAHGAHITLLRGERSRLATNSTRIFRHFKVIENQPRVLNQFAYFLRNANSTFGFDEADSEAAQSGDVLWAMSCPDAAAVFMVVPINHVVATVFDAPMLAVRLKDFLGISLFGIATGNSVNDFVSAFTRFLVEAFPLDHEGLANLGKIQVSIKRRGCPDFAGFDASVIG